MFKVTSKRATTMTFGLFTVNYFTPFSSASIVGFKKVKVFQMPFTRETEILLVLNNSLDHKKTRNAPQKRETLGKRCHDVNQHKTCLSWLY